MTDTCDGDINLCWSYTDNVIRLMEIEFQEQLLIQLIIRKFRIRES